MSESLVRLDMRVALLAVPHSIDACTSEFVSEEFIRHALVAKAQNDRKREVMVICQCPALFQCDHLVCDRLLQAGCGVSFK